MGVKKHICMLYDNQKSISYKIKYPIKAIKEHLDNT